MNENLNLVEILKDCPSGTVLYSTTCGKASLLSVSINEAFPIKVSTKYGVETYTKCGKIFDADDGECVLFPSKEMGDWSKFKVKKERFDPKTLKPFDKVLVKYEKVWACCFFSHRRSDDCEYPYFLTDASSAKYCIPYNEDTKHLLGTNEEAPEFYRYWED